MTTTISLDKAGRVVLPKPVRDELQLQPGDTLEIESSEVEIILRPVRGNTALRKKRGIWVYRAGEALSACTVAETARQTREEHERNTLGRRR